MAAAELPSPAVFLREVSNQRWRFFRAVVAARLIVALSLGLLLPAQRELHGDLFWLIVVLWIALTTWVLGTTAFYRRIYALLNQRPGWLWAEEATVIVLLIGGGGFRNVFYFYGASPIVLAAVFFGARMAYALAGANSAALAFAFAAAHLIPFDPAIEDARFTEWWGAIVGYFVAGFLFAYLRTLFDRIERTARAYEHQAAELAARHRELAELRAADYRLTSRDLEVLRLLAAGRTNRQIAKDLHFAEQTVKNQIHRIFEKLGVSNRTQAATLARDRGLIS